MGGILSVILSDCFMNKMERDIVLPLRILTGKKHSKIKQPALTKNMNMDI